MNRALTGALALGALLSLGLGIAYAILSPDTYSLVVMLFAVVVAGVWTLQALQSLAGERAQHREIQRYLDLAAAALPACLQHLFGASPLSAPALQHLFGASPLSAPASPRKQPVLYRRVRGGVPGPVTTAPPCDTDVETGDQIWYTDAGDDGWRPLARYDGDLWELASAPTRVTGSSELYRDFAAWAGVTGSEAPGADPPASDAAAE